MSSDAAAMPRRLALGALGAAALAPLSGTCATSPPAAEPPAEFMDAGRRAMEWTNRFVALGPRPAGSKRLADQHDLMVAALSGLSCRVETNSFYAPTPKGLMLMRNVIARFGDPAAAQVIVVSGHYDTLRRVRGFVGANDGGSSAGLLMALAERLHSQSGRPVWLAFFDGEESLVAWRNGDHTYGSRHLAAKWVADGTASRIRALLNVDMIGDADLQLIHEGNSDAELRSTVWQIGNELGYTNVFLPRFGYIEDDHIPFVRAGVPSLNLIDFDYGPGNSYWHTLEDRMDKLSPRSFATVMHVLDVAIGRLLGELPAVSPRSAASSRDSIRIRSPGGPAP